MEVFFCLDTPQQDGLNVERHLPPQSLRLLLDASGNDLSSKVGFKGLSKQLLKMKKSLAREVVKQRQEKLRQLLDQAYNLAQEHLPSLLENAQQQMRSLLDPEIARLKALAEKNPALRPEEITRLEQLRQQLDQALNKASLRMDAVRVIVTTTGQE